MIASAPANASLQHSAKHGRLHCIVLLPNASHSTPSMQARVPLAAVTPKHHHAQRKQACISYYRLYVHRLHNIFPGTTARAPVRVRTVRCQAIAAPAKEAPSAPAAQGPIIMNGQILHSSTEKQLELVRGLSQSGYLQKQVRQKQHEGTTTTRG